MMFDENSAEKLIQGAYGDKVVSEEELIADLREFIASPGFRDLYEAVHRVSKYSTHKEIAAVFATILTKMSSDRITASSRDKAMLLGSSIFSRLVAESKLQSHEIVVVAASLLSAVVMFSGRNLPKVDGD